MQDFYEHYADRLMPIPNSGCLWWEGSTTPKGYGTINRNGRTTLAHRDAYEAVHGDGSAEGVVIRHSCDCPPCCEGSHLIGGTHQDNTDDMIARGRKRVLRGEAAGRALLTDDGVRLIRQWRAEGVSGLWLAKVFGVSRSTIYSAANGQSWRHLNGNS